MRLLDELAAEPDDLVLGPIASLIEVELRADHRKAHDELVDRAGLRALLGCWSNGWTRWWPTRRSPSWPAAAPTGADQAGPEVFKRVKSLVAAGPPAGSAAPRRVVPRDPQGLEAAAVRGRVRCAGVRGTGDRRWPRQPRTCRRCSASTRTAWSPGRRCGSSASGSTWTVTTPSPSAGCTPSNKPRVTTRCASSTRPGRRCPTRRSGGGCGLSRGRRAEWAAAPADRSASPCPLAPSPVIPLANGTAMPAIGLGTWPLNDDQVARTVVDAVEIGYRLVDTAAKYGNETGRRQGHP